MVTIKDVLEWVDIYAPFRYAASWDHVGLQVGSPEAGVERILVALDPGSLAIAEAEKLRCQCLVTHHPLFAKPMSALRSDQFPGSLAMRLLKKDIGLIAAHTNLDAARDGTNDEMAKLLELDSIEPLEVEAAWRGEERYGGMGRVGMLPEAVPLSTLVEELQDSVGGIGVRVVGDPSQEVRRVALCAGSGGSMVEHALAAGADVYITGDLKYHDAQRALEAKMALVDMGHFASERLIIRPFADFLFAQSERRLERFQVFTACDERDPFWFS